MPTRSRTNLTALAFAALSALSSMPCAQAQSTLSTETPGRVGRIALTQGQVRIAADAGTEDTAAQVNWPVTTGSTITTAAGARTEVRIGSTAIRLDGDSSLEVLALDDDELRLRLDRGSASVRVTNPDALAGFSLETPQAQVRLRQPSRVRVDAQQVHDNSVFTVFEGDAVVERGDFQLTVRAGRCVEVDETDMSTLAAKRNAFDDWALQRDRTQEAPTAARYVGTEMTGYEDLDRFGSWRVDDDYGPLWTPAVAAGWVPYRDGSWTWLEPWGWTWVDNAPWGYAPFHYGRWVQVHNRWAWAPGGRPDRPVWAPALVGWVGGAGWNLTFRDRHTQPALGWYPLSPWDRFVPSYHARDDHLRWLNGHVRERGRPADYRPQGVTVVPQDRFSRPNRIDVPRAPLATVPPLLVRDLPAAAPPMPAQLPSRQPRYSPPPRSWVDRDRTGDEARERLGRDGRIETARVEQDGLMHGRYGHPRPQAAPQQLQPQPLTTAPGLVPPAAPVQPLPVTSPTPRLPNGALPVTSPTPHPVLQQQQPAQPQPNQPQPGWQGRDRGFRDRDGDWRDRSGGDPGEWRCHRQPQAQSPLPQAPSPQPVMTAPPPRPLPQPAFAAPRPLPPVAAAAPQPAARPAAAAPAAQPAPAAGRAEGVRPSHGGMRGQRQQER
jgi:hypothetical protein